MALTAESVETTDSCPACGGKGYLVGQSELAIIQRCDYCEAFSSDEEAAATVAARIGTQYHYVQCDRCVHWEIILGPPIILGCIECTGGTMMPVEDSAPVQVRDA